MCIRDRAEAVVHTIEEKFKPPEAVVLNPAAVVDANLVADAKLEDDRKRRRV